MQYTSYLNLLKTANLHEYFQKIEKKNLLKIHAGFPLFKKSGKLRKKRISGYNFKSESTLFQSLMIHPVENINDSLKIIFIH